MHFSFRSLRSLALAIAGAGAITLSAHAALAVGAEAPDFSTTAAKAGQPFAFALRDALAQGPVVLYFFPKAFTKGCTLEANAFAEANAQFVAQGATVVGMSHDDIETLQRFSSEACRDEFAVASDPDAQTIRAYDAQSAARPESAQRISYVIDRHGRIAFVHSGSDPLEHVAQTLAAVQALAAGR